MEITQILIFALVGAVCAVIIIGGLSSMTSDSGPSTGSLAVAGVSGGVLAPLASVFLAGSSGGQSGGDGAAAKIMSAIGLAQPDMKVGLPNF